MDYLNSQLRQIQRPKFATPTHPTWTRGFASCFLVFGLEAADLFIFRPFRGVFFLRRPYCSSEAAYQADKQKQQPPPPPGPGTVPIP